MDLILGGLLLGVAVWLLFSTPRQIPNGAPKRSQIWSNGRCELLITDVDHRRVYFTQSNSPNGPNSEEYAVRHKDWLRYIKEGWFTFDGYSSELDSVATEAGESARCHCRRHLGQ